MKIEQAQDPALPPSPAKQALPDEKPDTFIEADIVQEPLLQQLHALEEKAKHAADRAAAAEQRCAETQAANAQESFALSKANDTIASLQDKIEELEANLEMAMLDREMAEEKTESLEQEVAQLKERTEELALELELHHEQATAEEVAMPVEQAQLQRQNVRLREALAKLRDLFHETDEEQKREIGALRKELAEAGKIQTEYEGVCDAFAKAKHVAEELRAQADLAEHAEEMLEQLTEQNGALQAHNESLLAEVQDLETLRAVNDELEETHLETEMQLQRELDARQEHLGALRAEKQAHDAQLADYDATLGQFRELVTSLTRELASLRGKEPERVYAPTLDVKATKMHQRAIPSALEQLDAEQLRKQLCITRAYVPPAFWSVDYDALRSVLFYERVARLGRIICETLASGTDVQEQLLARALDDALVRECMLRHALAHAAALAQQIAAVLGSAPPDVFIAHAQDHIEMAHMEQQLREALTTLQDDRFEESSCAQTCARIVPLLESVSASLQDYETLADLAAKEAGSAALAAHDVDTLLAALGYTHQMVASLDAPSAPLAKTCDVLSSLVHTIRRAWLPAGKMRKHLSNLYSTGETIRLASVMALPGLGQLSSTLVSGAVAMANAVGGQIEDNADALFAAVQGALLNVDLDMFQKQATELASTMDALCAVTHNADNVVQIVVDTPWEARAVEMHAEMRRNTEAEEREAALNGCLQALYKDLRRRDDALDAAALKVERVKHQLDKAREMATGATDMHAKVEALEGKLREAQETVPSAVQDTAQHVVGVYDLRRALDTLRQENMYLRSSAHLEKLAQLAPLATPPPTPPPCAADVEALGPLHARTLRLATLPRVVNVAQTPEKGWRSVRTMPRGQYVQQMEDCARVAQSIEALAQRYEVIRYP
ncbi:hypothetical protein MVES_000650 [Malassezia vespertilionis]|uniref:Dynein associated protein domain-containing protein n=2 Tax=Malassezia vespertilionis TaxID=2020962 RepID=A0A2N1JGS3_9BASI|nr:hypothetical protein MVES_000650 [Malassezia vespertilionis]